MNADLLLNLVHFLEFCAALWGGFRADVTQICFRRCYADLFRADVTQICFADVTQICFRRCYTDLFRADVTQKNLRNICAFFSA